MNKHEIYDLLNRLHIWHEITEHPAVYNMEEVASLELPHPEADAKCLFLRDDKKRQYYLVCVKGEKRVDIRALRESFGTRPLSFASDGDLQDILGLIPGAVTPLGLLNGPSRPTRLIIDEDLLDGPNLVGVHPNDNTATVWMRCSDLAELLLGFGCEVDFAKL